MILLENVSKLYNGDRYAVQDVSLRVPAGAMLVLLGGSGCGKTTILKKINRLIEPTAGRIEVGGLDGCATPMLLCRGSSDCRWAG
jgi:osmoprotectant transport system ATP-binding protein